MKPSGTPLRRIFYAVVFLAAMAAAVPVAVASPADDYYSKGSQYYRQGQYENSIAEFTKAIALDPDYVSAYNDRGLSYFYLKLYDKALDDYNKALSITPYAHGYACRGVLYGTLGRFDDALGELNKAIALDPGFADAYAARAYNYYVLQRYDDAVADSDKAVALKPRDPRYVYVYWDRALIYIKLGRFEDALTTAATAFAMDPEKAKSYVSRGYAYAGKKLFPEALADFDKALSLDPSTYDAHFGRARVFDETGRLPEALRDYENFIRSAQPGDPPADVTLAKQRAFEIADQLKASPAPASSTGAVIENQTANAPAGGGAKLTGFLGIPWGTSKQDTEKAILARPDAKRFNKGIFTGIFVGRTATFEPEYKGGKLVKGFVRLPHSASTDVSRAIFDDMKAQLIGKYGKPAIDNGYGLDTVVQWNVPGNGRTNYIKLSIFSTLFLLDTNSHETARKPMAVVITYYDGAVADQEKVQQKQNNNNDL